MPLPLVFPPGGISAFLIPLVHTSRVEGIGEFRSICECMTHVLWALASEASLSSGMVCSTLSLSSFQGKSLVPVQLCW